MDKELLKLFLDVIQTTAVIVGLVYGLNAWRREHHGRRRYELAEEVLAVFYEARDRIASIRNFVGFEDGGAGRKVARSETAEEKDARDRANVVYARYSDHRQFFSHLQSLRYRFMALFGRDAAKPFDDLARVMNEIFIAARMLARLWALKPSEGAAGGKLLDDIRRYEQVIWSEGDEGDLVLTRINKAVADIELTCGPIIQAAVRKAA